MRPPPSDGRRSLREQWNSSFTQFHKRRSSINYRNFVKPQHIFFLNRETTVSQILLSKQNFLLGKYQKSK